MTFLWREALWLLVILPALFASYVALLGRRRKAVRYASLHFIRDAAPPSRSLRRHIPPALFAVAMIAILLAVARPTAVATLPSEQRTIVLAIDVSLSMKAEDVVPNRLAAAQAAAKAFIRSQPRDVRIGIVAFAGDADLVQPPTTSREDALAAIDHLQLQYNTGIGNGVLAALLTILPQADLGADYDIFGMGRMPEVPRRQGRGQGSEQPRVRFPKATPGSYASAAIILLTDGRETIGVHHARAAQIAADHGIRVFTVGFGSAGHATVEVDGTVMDVSFDQSALEAIARTTRGAYSHATTAEELNAVYRTLKGQVVVERKSRELTALFTALAAMLSFSSAGLSLLWSNRIA